MLTETLSIVFFSIEPYERKGPFIENKTSSSVQLNFNTSPPSRLLLARGMKSLFLQLLQKHNAWEFIFFSPAVSFLTIESMLGNTYLFRIVVTVNMIYSLPAIQFWMELVMRLLLYNAPSSIYLGVLAVAVAYFNSLVMCIQGDQGRAGVPGDIGFQGDKVIGVFFSIIFFPLT